MRKNHEAKKLLEDLIGEPGSLGLYIRSIREGEELSQAAFSKKLGISVQHLSNVEHGRKSVSVERADAWARTLGYPEEAFVQLALRDQFERAGLHGFELTVKKAS